MHLVEAPLTPPASSSGHPGPKIIISTVSVHACLFLCRFCTPVAGGFVIKYGSLLISLPFEPSPLVALGVVLGTPALYSLYLLTQSGQQQQ
jgi:hypothetical protein